MGLHECDSASAEYLCLGKWDSLLHVQLHELFKFATAAEKPASALEPE